MAFSVRSRHLEINNSGCGACHIGACSSTQNKMNRALLTHSHTMTPFDALGNKPFENTVGKGEIARNEQFLLFPQ